MRFKVSDLPADMRRKLGCKPKGKRAPSELEESLAVQIELAGLPAPVREYMFHPERKWRMDFAFLAPKVGVECQGATYANGGHSRGSGIERDTEKLSNAAVLGWRVIIVTEKQIRSGAAVRWIAAALEQQKG